MALLPKWVLPPDKTRVRLQNNNFPQARRIFQHSGCCWSVVGRAFVLIVKVPFIFKGDLDRSPKSVNASLLAKTFPNNNVSMGEAGAELHDPLP